MSGAHLRIWGALLCAALMLIPVAEAQHNRTTPAREVTPGREYAQTLRNAQALVRQGHFDQGIAMLEELNRVHPHDQRIITTLGAAHEASGAYLRAAALYQAELQGTASRSADIWIRLANAYRRGGRGPDAAATLLEAVRQRPSWARSLYDQFELLATDSLFGTSALDTLESLGADPQAPSAWRATLAHVYVVMGRYEDGLALLMRGDREERTAGRASFELARTLARRGESLPALAAFDSVLTLSPPAGIAEESLFERAKILQVLGQPLAAVAAYQEQIERYPRGSLAMRGRLNAAALQMSALGDLGGAREAYIGILNLTGSQRERQSKANRKIHSEALLALGECALRAGDFDEADSTLARIGRTEAHQEIREQAAFERAEILFYQGRFPDAEDAYYRLTDHYPTGPWVNDALGRALLMGEFAQTSGAALSQFARVRYRERIGDRAGALELCAAALGDSAAAPMRAHFRFAEIRINTELAHFALVDSAVTLMLADDADSPLTPQALYLAAEVAEQIPERIERSAEYYETIVLRYPNSIEARRARNRLRALRDAREAS